MKLYNRFKRLTIWNKIGVVAGIITIVSLPFGILQYIRTQSSIITKGENNTVVNNVTGDVYVTYDNKNKQSLVSTGKITEGSANAAFIAKDYATAFEDYVNLSTADPTNINYHRRLEESARYGLLKKPFLDQYLKLVQQQPTNAIFYNYLGNAYLMIDPEDKEGKARTSYKESLRLNPQFAPPLANLGILVCREGNLNEAEALFKRYLAVQPNDAQTWVNLSLLYLIRIKTNLTDANLINAAEASLKKALKIDPSSFSAYKAMGRLYLMTNRKKDALDAYQRSLALNSEQPDVRSLLSQEFGNIKSIGTISDDFITRGRNDLDVNENPHFSVK